MVFYHLIMQMIPGTYPGASHEPDHVPLFHLRTFPGVNECQMCVSGLKSETARLMFANSEFLLLFNQAATDRAELSKLLHISDTQLSYITNAEAGHGLLRMGGSIVPFVNTIPRQTELYKLMTTTPGESR